MIAHPDIECVKRFFRGFPSFSFLKIQSINKPYTLLTVKCKSTNKARQFLLFTSSTHHRNSIGGQKTMTGPSVRYINGQSTYSKKMNTV